MFMPLEFTSSFISSRKRRLVVFRYYKGDGYCAAFLIHNGTSDSQIVKFWGREYHLPTKSVSILPDCKTVVHNSVTELKESKRRKTSISEVPGEKLESPKSISYITDSENHDDSSTDTPSSTKTSFKFWGREYHLPAKSVSICPGPAISFTLNLRTHVNCNFFPLTLIFPTSFFLWEVFTKQLSLTVDMALPTYHIYMKETWYTWRS